MILSETGSHFSGSCSSHGARNPGEAAELPISMIVTREVVLKNSFRLDVAPRPSDKLPLAQARKAFELASDKPQSMKVQIAFH
ncbi:MAG: hypothetical protein J0H31_09890 [Alphaproteobacteria bacterium]|nr:hypothetical protein [Alphaproteobacteria bacterium]